MWESTPPVVRTRQPRAGDAAKPAENSLDQLGVVEMGKHVGLFHEGPLSPSVLSGSRRSTPHASPQPAHAPTSTSSSASTTHSQSPRSVLSPNARPANPFTAPPQPTQTTHTMPVDGVRRMGSDVHARPQSLPLTAIGTHPSPSMSPTARQAGPSAGTRIHPTNVSVDLFDPHVGRVAPPATRSAGVDVDGGGPRVAAPVEKTSTPQSAVTAPSEEAPVSSASPAADTSVIPGLKRSIRPTSAMNTSQTSAAMTAASPSAPVHVMEPTVALVEAIPCEPILSTSTRARTSGGEHVGGGDVTHSSATSSLTTTATDGTEWVRWQHPAKESLERCELSTFPSRRTQTSPTNQARENIKDCGSLPNRVDDLKPEQPSSLKTVKALHPFAATALDPNPSHAHAMPSRPLTVTKVPSALSSAAPVDRYARSDRARMGPPCAQASLALSVGATSEPAAVPLRGMQPVCGNSTPLPMHMSARAAPPTKGAATTEDDDTSSGFYHGVSINNLERSFFFPSANASSLYGGSTHALQAPHGAVSGVGGENDNRLGPSRAADAGGSGPRSHAHPHGGVGTRERPNIEPADGVHASVAYEVMPSLAMPLTQSIPDDATTAAANREAALLAAMTNSENSRASATATSTNKSSAASDVRCGSPAPITPQKVALFTPEPLSQSSLSPEKRDTRGTDGTSSMAAGSTLFMSPNLGMAASVFATSVGSAYPNAATNSFCSPTLAALETPWAPGVFAPAATDADSASAPSTRPSTIASPPHSEALVLPAPVAAAASAASSEAAAATTAQPSQGQPRSSTTGSRATNAAGTASSPLNFSFQTGLVDPFQDHYRRYHATKDNCTDAYLTVVEQAVDSFLTVHFNPNLKSAAAAAVTGGRWGRAGQRLLQVGTTLLRRAGGTGGGGQTAPVKAHPSSGTPSPIITPHPKSTSGSTNASPGPIPPPSPSCAARDAMRAMRYTPDVIPARYLDERPSDTTLHAVALNYPALLCAMANFFPAEKTPDHPGSSPASTSEPDAAATAAATSPAGFHQSQHAAVRDGLILPTIYTVWRDYLTPLEGKAKEVLQIAEQEVLPALNQRLTSRQVKGSSQTTIAAELNALKAALAVTERAAQHIRDDLVYIQTIRVMDMDFCAELEGERDAGACARGESGMETATTPNKLSTRSRFRTGALSQYVPVFGLVLSRLNRLEMEHRTVLELWGPSKSSPAMRV